ncbi:MAG: hypothetical protein U1E56_04055 [Bauldia sp.]
MKLHLPGTVLALACCAASAAEADWEYTKWGMSPQQVVAASKNLAKESTDLSRDSDGNVTKLIAPYQGGKFSFEAQFAFDPSDKLASVTLVLYDQLSGLDVHLDMHGDIAEGMNMTVDLGICHDLDMRINTVYGAASYSGANHRYAIEKWQDPKNKNNVKYTALFDVGCFVQYSVIQSAGAN